MQKIPKENFARLNVNASNARITPSSSSASSTTNETYISLILGLLLIRLLYWYGTVFCAFIQRNVGCFARSSIPFIFH